ncbi:AAA family ATPase [Antarcticirhabdus aurantiaca]|uniref:AAA family ATPase n=1 Tax=Antarcticirhabdus aurantiaca TaxID=2606717 RepID=A0ACD4NRL8_9HYPH|nr:AAA family ATPase [Antarcticirhabdus aurantiaca]WAJ29461.1 AAA family ATPase [Jeongeuplla avenae]
MLDDLSLPSHSPSPSTARLLTPAARLANEILRLTLVDGGMERVLRGAAGIVVIHGVRPEDGSILHDAAEYLVSDDPAGPPNIHALARDWTEPKRLREDHLDRLILEISRTSRPVIVLCSRRSVIPPVLAILADAVLPLADRVTLVADVAEEVGGFRPDGKLLKNLTSLPLEVTNLILRPGVDRQRMELLARGLRRHGFDTHPSRQRRSHEGESGKKVAPAAAPPPPSVRPERLEDLPGMGEAQRWGLALARDIEAFRAAELPWQDIESGALLHGPPGTGKTMFAAAFAGSCGLPLHAHSVAAWQARGHLGDMLKAMRAAFDEARKAAPCVLFVDELDSVGSRDEPLGEHASYQRQVVNCLLECLDGSVGREGIVVVGATNNPSAIDPAIRRPGRLGRQIEIGLPDLRGRVGILRHHLRGDLADMDLECIAEEIGEASGATLAQVVREARSLARRERRSLRADDLRTASPPGITLSDAAFRRLCVHEAGHVVVGLELAESSGLVPVSATVRRTVRNGREPRTDFRCVEGHDRTRRSLDANIVVLLAGLAAEEVLLGSRGSGSGGTADADLVRATQLAASAERSLGLGSELVSVSWTDTTGPAELIMGDPCLRLRVEAMLAGCLRDARLIVERRRDEVEALARRLAESQSIDLA